MDEELILQAVSSLTAVCDGAEEKDSAGWSKAHATTGLTLSVIPPDLWNNEYFEWGRIVLPHYRKQLERMGYDLSPLQHASEKPVLDKVVAARVTDEGLMIVAQSSTAIATLINGVRGVSRHHDPGPHWIVSRDSAVNKHALQDKLNEAGVSITNELATFLQALPDVPPERLVALGNDGFIVTFPNDYSFRERFKEVVSGREFKSYPYPHWLVPFQKSPANQLLAFGREERFTFEEAVLNKIGDLQNVNEYRLSLSEDGIVISYPRSSAACDSAVRALPKRKFSYEPKPHWYAIVDSSNYAPLQDMIATFGFEVSASVQSVLDKMQAVAAALPAPRRVEVHGNICKVFSPYDDWLRNIMWGKGTFKKAEGCYDLAIMPEAVPILQALKGRGFVVPSTLMNALDGVVEAAEKAYAASKSDGGGVEQIVVPGGALRPFQNAGVAYMRNFLRKNGGTINGDDMGLGKSLMALATIELENAYPFVVIVPASLKINWRREVEKWLPHRTTSILKGRTPDATKFDADVIIINYDILGAWVDTFLEAFETFPAVAVDEAHLVKEKTAARTKAAKKLMDKAQRRIVLTGTPFKSRPVELWSLLEMAGMDTFFVDFFPYAKRYCGARQINIGRRMVWDFKGATNLDELHTKLRQFGMLRRLKSEVLKELPPKARYIVPLALSNQAEYNRAETEFAEWYNEQLRLKRDPDEEENENPRSLQAEAIVKMNALLQLAARGKLEDTIAWIKDRLDGSEEKLVVYAWHKDVQQALFDAFNTPDYRAVKIFGGEANDVRDNAVQQFQHNADVRVIVCSIASAGFGVTLTAASNLVMVESTWTPGEDEQVEDRVNRIGQTAGVAIWYMIAEGTLEEQRFKTVDKKRGDFTQAMDGNRKTSGASVAKDVMKFLAKKGKKHATTR